VETRLNERSSRARGSAEFERFLGETSRRLLASTPEAFPGLAGDLLRAVTAWYGTDRATLQRMEGDRLRVRFAWGRPELSEPHPPASVTWAFEWLMAELRGGAGVARRATRVTK
jgi:hypothetical protein